MAHWYDQVERARQDLVASLDDLRSKADGFLTVSALATTLFAVLTPECRTNGSNPNPFVSPASDKGSPPETQSPLMESKTADLIPLASVRSSSGTYPDADNPGIVRLPLSNDDVPRPFQTDTFPAITSPNSVIATVGIPLSFTVTTTGTPVPAIMSKGILPRYLAFVDNKDGTATIRGTPEKAGICHTTIKSKFGTGTSKYVLAQAFTLTIRR